MEQCFMRNYSLITLLFAFPFSTPTHLLSHPHTPRLLMLLKGHKVFIIKKGFVHFLENNVVHSICSLGEK